METETRHTTYASPGTGQTLESMFDKLETYVQIHSKLIWLRTVSRVSSLASALVMKSIIAFSFLFLLLFLSIGSAIWIGQKLDAAWQGFFMVAGFYGILIFVMWAFGRKWLQQKVSADIVQMMEPPEKQK